VKTYYSEYIQHCMRYYLSTSEYPFEFRHTSERLAWLACDKALKSFSKPDQMLIRKLFRGRDGVMRNVEKISGHDRVSKQYLMSLVNRFEKQAASARGLI